MSRGAAKVGQLADRERELKLGIPDEASFRALLGAVGGRAEEPVLQENHFFDTASRALSARHIGFRIREEAGRFTLTIKGPALVSDTAALTDRVEVEHTLSPERARRALSGEVVAIELFDPSAAAGGEGGRLVGQLEEACAGAPLQRVGSFRNERIRVRTTLAESPVELEFDRTFFGDDDVRFELELELEPGAPVAPVAAALEALFRESGVRPVPTTSKLEHFLKRLDAS